MADKFYEKVIYKEVTFSCDTNQYATNDVLAATQEIPNAVPADSTFIWDSVVLLDKDDQGQNIDVYLLRTNVAIGTENAAVSISDANADEIVGYVLVDDWKDLIGSQMAQETNIGAIGQAGSAATSLYVALVCREGTPTYTASGITGKFGFRVMVEG